jgi:hypothetical protein
MLLALAAAGVATGQVHGVRVGVEGGALVSTVSTAVPVYAGSGECGEFTSMQGNGVVGGVRITLPALFGGGFGATLRLGYAASATASAVAAPEPLVLFLNEADTAIEIPREYRLELDEERLELALSLAYGVTERWSIAVGPWIATRLATTVRQVERVSPVTVNGESYTLDSGVTERPIDFPTPFAPSSIVGGVSLSTWYAIPFGRFLLEPTITLDVAPISSVRDLDWRELRAMFTLPLSYGIGGDTTAAIVDAPVAVPVDSPATAPTVVSTLSASLELIAVDDLGGRIAVAPVTVFETIERSRVAVDPVVRFVDASAALPDAYRARTAEGFDPEALALDDPGALRARMLDLVGWRMQRRSDARVVLSPGTAAGEPTWLSFARAEAVRSYLEEVWGVERARIEIRPASRRGSRDAASRRRVEIVGEPRELTGPYVAERSERSIDPPTVQLVPSYTSNYGGITTSVVLMHDGRAIARYGSDDRDGTDSSVSWQITPDRIGKESELSAELRVRDASGAEKVAVSRLPIRLERRTRHVERSVGARDSVERIVVSLFDDRGELSARNRDLIAATVRDLPPGSRITIDATPAVRDEVAAAVARSGRSGIRVRTGTIPAKSPIPAGSARLAVERPRH